MLLDGLMDEWTDVGMDGKMAVWMDRWVDGRMVGWKDVVWMDGKNYNNKV